MTEASLMEIVKSYVEDNTLKKKIEEERIKEDGKKREKENNKYFNEILNEAIELFNEEYHSEFDIGDKVEVIDGSYGVTDKGSWGYIESIGTSKIDIEFHYTTGYAHHLPCVFNISKEDIKVVEKKYEPFKDFKIPELNSVEEYELFKQKTLENILYKDLVEQKIHKLFSEKLRKVEENMQYIKNIKPYSKEIKMQEKEKTPFQINYRHTYNLRDWIKQEFPFIDEKHPSNYCRGDYDMIEERAVEIVDACRTIEEIDLRAGSAYINYFKEDWKRIKESYQNNDFKAMAEALEILIDAINVE